MSSPFWLELIACPMCKAPMTDLRRCRECRLEFGQDHGLPRLMSPSLKHRFDIHFDNSAHALDEEVLLQALTEPPVDAPHDDLPYHLDPAHARIFREQPHGRVLDVGCGGCQVRGWLTRRGFDYVGVDAAVDQFPTEIPHEGDPDLLCDAHFLPFLNEKFDIVYCAAMFHYLACPPLMLHEAFRVLKPGGLFLGNCAFLEPWIDRTFFHMTPLGVICLLKQEGFDVRHIWPGKGYSGFYAIPAMAFRGPFKSLRHMGNLIYQAYRLQTRMQVWVRTIKKKEPVSPMLVASRVAGAFNWIAQRPLAGRIG